MKLVFEKKSAAVRYEKEGTDFSIAGGTMHLVNMITNLIDNSLKYSPQNPVILVTLHATSDAVTLSVKDEGIGIPAEYHRKIFEKFFRVPTGDVHNTKGYGLGLSYVASVVKSHGGTIKVNSEPGKGSEFVITLPKRPFLIS
jgi:signal transduction histidine kinase